MPNVHGSIDVSVWCSCGEGLCSQATGGDGTLEMEPCQKCVENARSEGFEDGFNQGKEEGYEQGQQDIADEGE